MLFWENDKNVENTNFNSIAVRLFSTRLLTTSKCGNNKKVAVPLGECVTDVLTTFYDC